MTDLNYHIPTDDGDVRSLLRSLGEPITLFGEDKADRRSRLIKLISSDQELYNRIVQEDVDDDVDVEGYDKEQEEEYFEPVSEDPEKCDELYDLRVTITKFSLEKSRSLTDTQYKQFHEFDMVQELKARRQLYKDVSAIDLIASKMISDRPISHLKIQGGNIITSSWNGELKIFENDDNLTELKCYKEEEKISKITTNSSGTTIITGNFVGDVSLYNDDKSSILHLHDQRVTDLAIHPFVPELLITSSFDKTFKLFDLNKMEPVYQQLKTHAKEIFRIGLNPAGSLLSTCGLDSVIRIWDLRTGKAVTDLTGHQSGVYSNAWHSNGHQLITGSNDCTVKVWDMRNTSGTITNLPIHSKLVSDLKISDDGKWFASASYDRTIKLTTFDSFQPIKTLAGHDDKVTTLDLQGTTVMSSGWDRSLNIWSSSL